MIGKSRTEIIIALSKSPAVAQRLEKKDNYQKAERDTWGTGAERTGFAAIFENAEWHRSCPKAALTAPQK